MLDRFGFATFNERDNEIVLAFRGTNGADFLNWMTNIVYYRVQYGNLAGSFVHSGFYTAYSAVAAQVREAISGLIALNPQAPILVTGHSLGAALATFAMLDMKENLKFTNPIKFYSFGSPRVGDQIFTNYFMNMFPADTYQRVTHYTDVVVQIPPRQMSFNHAGTEVWYYNEAFDSLKRTCSY
jgi:predicted lipase